MGKCGLTSQIIESGLNEVLFLIATTYRDQFFLSFHGWNANGLNANG
jgi:hypothetical protein